MLRTWKHSISLSQRIVIVQFDTSITLSFDICVAQQKLCLPKPRTDYLKFIKCHVYKSLLSNLSLCSQALSHHITSSNPQDCNSLLDLCVYNAWANKKGIHLQLFPRQILLDNSLNLHWMSNIKDGQNSYGAPLGTKGNGSSPTKQCLIKMFNQNV